jgi:hypothetical protein
VERKGDAWCEHGLVFPSAIGTPLTPRNLVRRFQELLQRAGLPARRFHDLRHTAASLMFERGLKATPVQRVLGHSSIAVPNDTYLHLMPRVKSGRSRSWTTSSRARRRRGSSGRKLGAVRRPGAVKAGRACPAFIAPVYVTLFLRTRGATQMLPRFARLLLTRTPKGGVLLPPPSGFPCCSWESVGEPHRT